MNKEEELKCLNQTIDTLSAMTEEQRKEEFKRMAKGIEKPTVAFLLKWTELFGKQ